MPDSAGLDPPVSVPLAVLFIGDGIQVWQRDDVAAVRAVPLLNKAALPVLQLALVLVGDADVGVVILHAHPGHGGVVALQELMVHPLVLLYRRQRNEPKSQSQKRPKKAFFFKSRIKYMRLIKQTQVLLLCT